MHDPTHRNITKVLHVILHEKLRSLLITLQLLLTAFIFPVSGQSLCLGDQDAKVLCGADVLFLDSLHLISGKRVGVITNHTGVLADGRPLLERLQDEASVTLAAVFAPEHGVQGSVPAGVHIPDGKQTGVTLYSLYGKTRKPTQTMLAGLDVLLYDIQDAGSRYYTYISTLALCLEAASEAAIPLIVLDRPNPLGGVVVEGPVRQKEMKAFVALLPVPVRHAMTTGELARMMTGEGWVHASPDYVHVLPMRGWKRFMYYEDTGLRWVPPSPNLVSVDAAIAYAGTCLLEGTAISEGRGTTAPFLQFGAPFMDSAVVVNALSSLKLQGVRFDAATFVPISNAAAGSVKHAGRRCFGVRMHITDRDIFRPFETGRKILIELYRLYGEKMGFTSYLAVLAGVRDFADRCIKKADAANECDWTAEAQNFLSRRKYYLLYP